MRRRDLLEGAAASAIAAASSSAALAITGPSMTPQQQLMATNQRVPVPGVSVLKGGFINTANSTVNSLARPNWKGRVRYGFGPVVPPSLTWVFNQFRINAIAATPESIYNVNLINVIKAACVCYDSAGNLVGNSAPVTYRGARSFTIPPGAIEWFTDPMTPAMFGLAAFPANGWVDWRVVQTGIIGLSHATAGQTWECSQTWLIADGWTDDIDATGVMVAGAVSNVQGAFMAFPSYAIAVMPAGFASMLFIGDSIAFRLDDVTGKGFIFGGGGLQKRAANAINMPWTCMAIGGRTYSMAVNSAACKSIYKRFTLADLQLGSNDIANGSDLPTMDAAVSSICRSLRSVGVGWIGAHSITPRCNENNDHSNTANLWMATNQAVMTPYWTQATIAKGFPADGWGFGPGETRDTWNSINLQAKVLAGEIDSVFDFSYFCQDKTTTWKWAVSSYTATLTSALAANAQTCVVSAAPSQYANMVFEPGVANVDNPAAQGSPWAFSQSGPGPYTINFIIVDSYTGPGNFGGVPAKSHAIGTTVKETYSPDSTHPSAKPILAALPYKTAQFGAIGTARWGEVLVPQLPAGTFSNIYGMSYDGSVFVGFGNQNGDQNNQPVYTYDAVNGHRLLPVLVANSFAGIGQANRDATAVCGYADPGNQNFYQHAVYWEGGPNAWTITDLTPEISYPGFSQAESISADGKTVVGWKSADGAVYNAFVWTRAGGMVALPPAAGDAQAFAYAISEDGTIIAGSSGNRACYWKNGVCVPIGTLPGDATAFIVGMSSDASVMVGVSRTAANSVDHGIRWTAAGGMVDIGAAGGGRVRVDVRGCSGDGSTLIGVASDISYGNAQAFVWDAVNLYTPLSPTWPNADGVTISKDGRTAGGDNYSQGLIWRRKS